MKKLIAILVLFALLVSFLTSCESLFGNSVPTEGDTSQSEAGSNDDGGTTDNATEDNTEGNTEGNIDGGTEDNVENNTDGENKDNTENNTGDGESDNTENNTDNGTGDNTVTYEYISFTPAEKNLFTALLGELIPFQPNNEYYVEEYAYDGESGINFYTFGNTQAEFESYLEAFAAYTLVDTYEDGFGDMWYTYQKGEYYVDICYYLVEDENCLDVYAYIYTETGGNGGDDSGSGEHLYTGFTSDEKSKLTSLLGEVIPFIPNSDYYFEDYEYDGDTIINFYTFGNTQAEFEAYLNSFSAYTLIETYDDEYGDTWYVYQKGDFCVEMSFYEYDGTTCTDVYAYIYTETGGDNGGGSTGGGSDGDADLITNDGKGLPEGVDGVYEVNFKDAEIVKDVTDQGYYLDGCPTVGSPGVLVIPVQFSDITAQSKGYSLSTLTSAFEKDGQTDYYSVYDYYKISSYGQLTIDVTVLDFWFEPKNTSTYYQNATQNVDGSRVAIGDQLVLDEALAYLESRMDLSKFDSDNNGIIDAVILVTTLDIGDDDFHWAYRYWNVYTDDDGNYYEYDNVSANDYIWASYEFLFESYDDEGNAIYTDKSVVNPYTFIHEFAHVLGVDDYYDTSSMGNHPMNGLDIMDGMMGDHNAFTKINLGWITTSRLVTTDSTITLTLEDFSKSGDTIIVADNWDPALGAYQEYYVIMYYKSTGLNSGEGGYFTRDGVVVYHVNASLYREEIDGEVYYDIYYNNTDPSDEYGTDKNLIEYVKSNADTYTYIEGDIASNYTYGIFVVSITDDCATITFSKSDYPIID